MSTKSEQSEHKGALFLCVAILCFGSVPVFLKHFTAYLDAWTVNGIRYGVAALFWLPFVLRNHRKVPAGRNVWRDALLPALFNTAAQVGWAIAPYHNDAGVIGFVIRSAFLFSTLFGCWFLPSERTIVRRPLFWMGAGGIAAGLIVMYGGSLQQGSTSPLGMTILLATAVAWAMYGVSVRRHMQGYGVRISFGVISLYTTLALWVFMLLFGNWKQAAELSPQTWAMLALSAMLGIAFSHVSMYLAIHILGPVITEGGLALQPFVTALAAALALGEHLGLAGWLGGCLLAASCFCLISVKRFSKPREKT